MKGTLGTSSGGLGVMKANWTPAGGALLGGSVVLTLLRKPTPEPFPGQRSPRPPPFQQASFSRSTPTSPNPGKPSEEILVEQEKQLLEDGARSVRLPHAGGRKHGARRRGGDSAWWVRNQSLQTCLLRGWGLQPGGCCQLCSSVSPRVTRGRSSLSRSCRGLPAALRRVIKL